MAKTCQACSSSWKSFRLPRLRALSAPPPQVIAFVCQHPLTCLLSDPSLGSLSGNDVEEEGATAIAAILNETKITTLKCAAAPSVRFRVSAP